MVRVGEGMEETALHHYVQLCIGKGMGVALFFNLIGISRWDDVTK